MHKRKTRLRRRLAKETDTERPAEQAQRAADNLARRVGDAVYYELYESLEGQRSVAFIDGWETLCEELIQHAQWMDRERKKQRKKPSMIRGHEQWILKMLAEIG